MSSHGDEALQKWRAQAAESEQAKARAIRERRAEERAILASRAHPAPDIAETFRPVIEAVAEAVCEKLDELRAQVKQRDDKIRDLELEIAKFGRALAEMRTERILAGPGSTAALRAVN